MKFLRSPFLWLGVVCLLALWWALRPGSPEAVAEGGVEKAKPVEVAEVSVEPDAPDAEKGSNAERVPVAVNRAEPRPVAEIHRAILAEARKVVETGAGGADAATKDELVRRTKEIEALGAGGRGFSHPSSILMLAEFSRYLDTFGSFDVKSYKANMTAYFTARLKEVDALPDDGDMNEVRERWQRDLARDDLPEALLIRNVYGDKVQSKSWIERLLADLSR